MDLSHIDESGAMHMVDVSAKNPLRRTAVARGSIRLRPETVKLLREGLLKKGDALACARVAGIMAAKRTADLVPLCHSLALDHAGVEFEIGNAGIDITATTVCVGRTGVEMEALVAVSTAALAIYDMCKAVDREMVIGDIRLVEKRKEPA